jgi:hypothetical protein
VVAMGLLLIFAPFPQVDGLSFPPFVVDDISFGMRVFSSAWWLPRGRIPRPAHRPSAPVRLEELPMLIPIMVVAVPSFPR